MWYGTCCFAGMHNQYHARILSGSAPKWLCWFAFLAFPLAGCGTSDPQPETPSGTAETQRSANFVSARPPSPATTSGWQQPASSLNEVHRFSRFRPDPAVPNDNPWAAPAHRPPSSTTPGYSQPYHSVPPRQAYPGTQAPTYRYRPLSKKEIEEIQRQQHWSAESQYRNHNPYASPQPTQPAPPVNPWDDRRQWGRYQPPSRDR